MSNCRPIKWTNRRNGQIFRQVHSLPGLSQEETENVNKLIASIEINNAYVQQDMPEIRVDDIEFDNFQVALDYLVYHSKI